VQVSRTSVTFRLRAAPGNGVVFTFDEEVGGPYTAGRASGSWARMSARRPSGMGADFPAA
jgi:hypothetical protein